MCAVLVNKNGKLISDDKEELKDSEYFLTINFFSWTLCNGFIWLISLFLHLEFYPIYALFLLIFSSCTILLVSFFIHCFIIIAFIKWISPNSEGFIWAIVGIISFLGVFSGLLGLAKISQEYLNWKEYLNLANLTIFNLGIYIVCELIVFLKHGTLNWNRSQYIDKLQNIGKGKGL